VPAPGGVGGRPGLGAHPDPPTRMYAHVLQLPYSHMDSMRGLSANPSEVNKRRGTRGVLGGTLGTWPLGSLARRVPLSFPPYPPSLTLRTVAPLPSPLQGVFPSPRRSVYFLRMAIHSLREQVSKKRSRKCDCCGGRIEVGEPFWARNSSVRDWRGERMYSFTQTHLGCERLVNEMEEGVEKVRKGMSLPGWLPGSLAGKGEGILEELEGWGCFTEEEKEAFVKMSRRKSGRKEVAREYRYYDPSTKERTCFKATLDEVVDLMRGEVTP